MAEQFNRDVFTVDWGMPEASLPVDLPPGMATITKENPANHMLTDVEVCQLVTACGGEA